MYDPSQMYDHYLCEKGNDFSRQIKAVVTLQHIFLLGEIMVLTTLASEGHFFSMFCRRICRPPVSGQLVGHCHVTAYTLI